MLADQASTLRRYPTDAGRAELGLTALLPSVEALLFSENAPPRLVAHLTLVHDVALRLVAGVAKAWPRLSFDKEAVAWRGDPRHRKGPPSKRAFGARP